MRTNLMRQAVRGGVLGMSLLVASVASADVTSDQSGAILIFPKIVVDTQGVFGDPTDTIIQMTNTSNSVVSARCFYVNATGHCSDDGTTPCTEATASNDCSPGARCEPEWSKRDFRLTLTKRQPLAWQASEGLTDLPCDGIGSPDGCAFGLSNIGSDGSVSSIPLVQEDPFYGELKCVQVDPETFNPSAGFNAGNGGAGDLKGEATIVSTDGSTVVDASKHNAVALQSTTSNDGDDVLQIGGTDAEYDACPHVLTVNHLFEGATVEYGSGAGASTVRSDLTVVPCSQDFLTENANLGGAVLQFLIFNEFEQRFSASTSFECWADIPLSDIDTRPGPFGDDFSIFSATVQGTLGGQTRIRPVADSNAANGVLAVLEENWTPVAGGPAKSNAANVHFSGATSGSDQIILSPDN